MADEVQITVTDNEKQIGDSIVTILQYAKQQLPAGSNLVGYVAGEIGKLSAESNVTVEQTVDAGFDLGSAVCNEANAPHVSKLFIDLKGTANDGIDGKIGALIGDGISVIHDFQVIKKQGK